MFLKFALIPFTKQHLLNNLAIYWNIQRVLIKYFYGIIRHVINYSSIKIWCIEKKSSFNEIIFPFSFKTQLSHVRKNSYLQPRLLTENHSWQIKSWAPKMFLFLSYIFKKRKIKAFMTLQSRSRDKLNKQRKIRINECYKSKVIHKIFVI